MKTPNKNRSASAGAGDPTATARTPLNRDDVVGKAIVASIFVEIVILMVWIILTLDRAHILEALAYVSPIAGALVAGFGIYSSTPGSQNGSERLLYFVSACLLQFGLICFWVGAVYPQHTKPQQFAEATVMVMLALPLLVFGLVSYTKFEKPAAGDWARIVFYGGLAVGAACLVGMGWTLTMFPKAL